jgi:NADH:ubiquinone oxidoreductase subunit E
VAVENEKVQSFIQNHNSRRQALIAILQAVQAEYNYLPEESLRLVARSLGVPLVDVVGVATFYRTFSLKPRGKHTCLVCLGTACHVRGGQKILEEIERKLGVPAGENTKDGQFTLETAACLGCCAIGPVVVVDGEYHGHATIRKVAPILDKHRKPKASGKRPKAAAKPSFSRGGRPPAARKGGRKARKR